MATMYSPVCGSEMSCSAQLCGYPHLHATLPGGPGPDYQELSHCQRALPSSCQAPLLQ